jgi:hypothetical protein
LTFLRLAIALSSSPTLLTQNLNIRVCLDPYSRGRSAALVDDQLCDLPTVAVQIHALVDFS